MFFDLQACVHCLPGLSRQLRWTQAQICPTGESSMITARIGCMCLMLLHLLAVSSVGANESDDSCTLMAKQFFLQKMRNDIGPSDDPLAEHPDLIRGMMMRIKIQYPESDTLACINDGLIAARASLNIYVIDKMHGGVRSLQ